MLTESSAAVVRATLPAVQAHVTAITGRFYQRMFAAHPELLDLFNRGNQATGAQQAGAPDGMVSTFLHDRVAAGDALRLSPPFGEVSAVAGTGRWCWPAPGGSTRS